jgi:hypothetical protein
VLSLVFGFATEATASPTYVLTPNVTTWTGAEAYAQSLGGHLVTINDAAEQALLVSLFGGNTRYWIGFNDLAVEGNFEWVNGEPVTYTNWALGEPNNLGNEDFAVMNWTAPGNWNDLPDAGPGLQPTFGIVELVPEPMSLAVFGAIGLGAIGYARRRMTKATV